MKEPSPYLIRRVSPLDGAEIDETGYPANVDEPGFDPWRYWRCLRKRLSLVLAVPVALGVIVGLHDLMATRLYTAQATILIKAASPQLFEGTSIGFAPDNGAGATDSDLAYNTQYELLKARSLAAKVVAVEDLAHNRAFTGAGAGKTWDLLGGLRQRAAAWAASLFARGGGQGSVPRHPPAKEYGAPSWLIGAYLADLRIKPVENTELVEIGFTTSDPRLSARLANAHAREFIRQGIELSAQTSEEAARFLTKKLAEIKRRLEESELALNNYRRDKGIIPGLISVDGKEDVILERLNKLSGQLQDAHLNTIGLGTDVALARQGRADALPSVIGNSMIQALRGALDNLQVQYATMSREFKPNYPTMVKLRERIGGTTDALRREEQSAVASIKARHLAALKKEQDLEAELKREKDFALGLNDAAVRYAILQREADTNRQLYNAVLKRMKDIEVMTDLRASNVSIVDRAAPPAASSQPRAAHDLWQALMLGLAGGIGLAFMLDYLDSTLKGPEEVETYLETPALGVVPDFSLDHPAHPVNGRPANEAPNGAAAHRNEVALSHGSCCAAGEAYRMLRSALLLSRAGAPPKISLVTSTVVGEGKTVTAVNTAIVLAMSWKKVLLIDADLRRPACHRVLAVKNHLGLTEALTGARTLGDLIRPTTIDGLFFLSSGEAPPNPSELLGSDKMREILAALAEQYDHIIIDSPPVMQVSESVLLSTMVDGVVLVIGRATPKQRVRAALSRLRYARAKLLGAVLNRINTKSVDYHYYYADYRYDYYGENGRNGAAGAEEELSH